MTARSKENKIRMMKAEELIGLQIRLEYQVEGDQLTPFPGSTEQARFIVYRHTDGFARFYRRDMPPQMRQELERLDPELAFEDSGRVVSVLNAHSRNKAFGLFESCFFPDFPQADAYPEVVQDGNRFVVQVDGQPVCWAWSERSNERCAEVAVETLPTFRRRGYSRQAVSALAAAEMERGKVVFYSYELGNLASRELGQSLGVVFFAACAAFD